MAFQYTIAKEIEVSGIGLHTGQICTVRICPADAGEGIAFIVAGQRIPALAESVVSTQRSTVLGNTTVRISPVEHLLSSIKGMGIQNSCIEVSGPEIPVLDGGAAEFVKAIKATGRKRQKAEKQVVELNEPVWVVENDSLLLALPASTFRLTYIASFPALATQTKSIRITPAIYADEIAPARTIAFRDEIAALLAQGLGKGGSMDNVIVLGKDGIESTLRFPDEPVRHKLLDLVGDLALLGKELNAHVIAIRSGHKLNVDLVKRINEIMK